MNPVFLVKDLGGLQLDLRSVACEASGSNG